MFADIGHVVIGRFGRFPIAHAFAIGRIADDHAVFARRLKLQKIELREADVARDASRLGVRDCQLDGPAIDVRRREGLHGARSLQAFGLFAGFFPASSRQPGPLLSQKVTLQTWGTIPPDESGFDGDCSRTAEGIEEIALGVPEAELYQRGCDSLTQRSRPGDFAITAFVEAIAGRVDRERDAIFQDRNFNREFRPGFLEPVPLVSLLQV